MKYGLKTWDLIMKTFIQYYMHVFPVTKGKPTAITE